MAQPEAYVGGVSQVFDASGRLVDERTRTALATFIQAYAAWVVANAKS